MRTDKNIAIKLRLEGKSYSQIQALVPGISKSTLSLWLQNIVMSDAAREKIATRTKERSLAGLLKRNKNQTYLANKRKDEARKTAKAEIKSLSDNNLFLIGLALYWAEGYKRPKVKNGRELPSHPISLTNSDPALVRMFLVFLRKICKVPEEKITADLRIFQYLNKNEVVKFWVKETGIPETRFGKTYLGISRSSMGKRPFNRLPFGVIQIRINDTNLFHKIMGWIEGIKAQMPG